MRSKYNRVGVEDFDYYDVLGVGGFGTVLRVKKKSTKRDYAMKIVNKKHLLNNFLDDPSRVDLEVKTMAAIRHPFIIGMEYSFQTPTYGFMIMELAGGNIRLIFIHALAKDCRWYTAKYCRSVQCSHSTRKSS
jgi:serine/threonine protein kinase